MDLLDNQITRLPKHYPVCIDNFFRDHNIDQYINLFDYDENGEESRCFQKINNSCKYSRGIPYDLPDNAFKIFVAGECKRFRNKYFEDIVDAIVKFARQDNRRKAIDNFKISNANVAYTNSVVIAYSEGLKDTQKELSISNNNSKFKCLAFQSDKDEIIVFTKDTFDFNLYSEDSKITFSNEDNGSLLKFDIKANLLLNEGGILDYYC